MKKRRRTSSPPCLKTYPASRSGSTTIYRSGVTTKLIFEVGFLTSPKQVVVYWTRGDVGIEQKGTKSNKKKEVANLHVTK